MTRQITTRRIERPVKAVIEDLIARGLPPAQIQRELERRVVEGSADVLEGAVYPSLRTIERMWKRAQPPDPSGPWSLRDSPGSEGILILEVLVEVMKRTKGQRSTLTREEAAWIARVRTVAPSLPAWGAFRVAHAYVARGEQSTEDLDQLLAFQPWQSREAFDCYETLVRTDKGRPHPDGFNLALTLSAGIIESRPD